jgi:hypothetical protein
MSTEKAAPRGAWPFRTALIAVCVLRLGYSLIAFFVAPHLRLDMKAVATNALTEHVPAPSAETNYRLYGAWERFDTLWYMEIAEHGYRRPDAVVYQPLYPLLLRAAGTVVRPPVAAALLVATAATFFLLWGFAKLLALDLAPEVARRAVWLYAVWPMGFVFFVGYAESLVAATLVWSIYFARTNQFWAAGLCGLASGLAKAVGTLVAVPLALIAYRRRSWKALPAALCLAAPVVYVAWLKANALPLPTQSYARYWNILAAWPWQTVAHVFEMATVHPLLRLHVILLAMTAVFAFVKPIRREYTLYCLCALVLLLTKYGSAMQEPFGRYALVLFAAPAGLARMLEDRISAGMVFTVFGALNVLLFWSFLRWSLVV